MRKIMATSSVVFLVLTACTQANVTGSAKTYAFAAQAQAGYSAQAGTATRTDLSTGDTSTVLIASGLRPSTAYVAHYRAQGDVTLAPCVSGGAIVGDQGSLSVIGNAVFSSDASGGLTIRGLSSTFGVSAAKAIDLQEATSPATVPLCADLTLSPTKR